VIFDDSFVSQTESLLVTKVNDSLVNDSLVNDSLLNDSLLSHSDTDTAMTCHCKA
jgi:hypothetical protein